MADRDFDRELRVALHYLQENIKIEKSRTYARLRERDPESDEYARQYALFHYDFYRTQGFGIKWEKFDFFFTYCRPYDGAPPLDSDQTNEEVIKEEKLRAIAYYNENNGANIVFHQHIEANFRLGIFYENWITFWAVDMSSGCHEPKIYQTYTKSQGRMYEVPIFRVKPTEEEMVAAAPIHIELPPPVPFDPSKPMLAFDFAGPGDDPIPGTPYIFKRVPYPPLHVPRLPPHIRRIVIRPPIPQWVYESSSHLQLMDGSSSPRDDPIPGTPFVLNRVPHPLPPPHVPHLPPHIKRIVIRPPIPKWMNGSSSRTHWMDRSRSQCLFVGVVILILFFCQLMFW